MLDVGWTEILVIAIVLIIVVGPKDLPQMLRTFGRMMSKMRGMASDFRHQFDEALREADLEDVKKTIGEAQKLNPLNTIRDAVNPLRQMGNDIKADLQKTTSSVSSSSSAAAPVDSVSSAPVAVPSEAPPSRWLLFRSRRGRPGRPRRRNPLTLPRRRQNRARRLPRSWLRRSPLRRLRPARRRLPPSPRQ
jgi:Tat protein translocase TatB subunit